MKKYLGRSKEEIEKLGGEGSAKVKVGEGGVTLFEIEWDGQTRNITPEHICSMVVTQVTQNVSALKRGESLEKKEEEVRDHAVKECVVAVPFVYGEEQLKSVRDSFGLSGVKVVRFFNFSLF